MREKAPGAEHPNTLINMTNLASSTDRGVTLIGWRTEKANIRVDSKCANVVLFD